FGSAFTQSPPYQLRRTMADVAGDGVLVELLATHLTKRSVDGADQIALRVDERPVQIENERTNGRKVGSHHERPIVICPRLSRPLRSAPIFAKNSSLCFFLNSRSSRKLRSLARGTKRFWRSHGPGLPLSRFSLQPCPHLVRQSPDPAVRQDLSCDAGEILR